MRGLCLLEVNPSFWLTTRKRAGLESHHHIRAGCWCSLLQKSWFYSVSAEELVLSSLCQRAGSFQSLQILSTLFHYELSHLHFHGHRLQPSLILILMQDKMKELMQRLQSSITGSPSHCLTSEIVGMPLFTLLLSLISGLYLETAEFLHTSIVRRGQVAPPHQIKLSCLPNSSFV